VLQCVGVCCSICCSGDKLRVRQAVSLMPKKDVKSDLYTCDSYEKRPLHLKEISKQICMSVISMKRDVELDLYIYKVSEKRPTLYAALENCEGDKQSR